MVFRERAREIRKKFSRGSSSTSGTSSEASSTVGDELTRHTTHTMYRPGEKIPYKYRRPVDKEHKEKLEAFCFSSAWNDRRKSFSSQYSPMGSRLPSARNSMDILHAPPRTLHLRRGDTDLTEGSDEDSTPSHLGLSRQSSHNNPFDNALLPADDFKSHRPRSRHDTPFSAEDLTLALQRSRLGVSP